MELNKLQNTILEFLETLDLNQIIKVNIFKDTECKFQIPVVNHKIIIPATLYLQILNLLAKETTLSVNQKNLKTRLIEFINSQELDFSFNYFDRNYSKDKPEYNLPDDLDDTALALQALITSQIEIDDSFILKIIDLENAEGGPYRTWYVANQKKYKIWHDVDPVVNANLLYTLSLVDLKLKNTHKYIEGVIESGIYTSKYYPSKFIFFYYISKYAKKINKTKFNKLLIDELTIQVKSNSLTILDKLLYAISIRYLDGKVDEEIEKELIQEIKLAKFKNPMPFCYDYNIKDGPTYIGNSAISSILYLEFLLLSQSENSPKDREVNEIDVDLGFFENEVKKQIKLEISELDVMAKLIFQKYPLNKQYKSINFPFLIARSLKSNLTKNNLSYLSNLSKALYYGWCGYTIIDDLLDNQCDSKEVLLSLKLIRLYEDSIENLYINNDIKFKAYTDEVEANYYWESVNLNATRVNKLETFKLDYISKRMNAFIELCSDIPRFLEIKKFERLDLVNFLKNLMIIDQLNDDAHDWQEDLNSNILTLPTYLCLKYKIETLNEEEYWQKVMPVVLSKAKTYYTKALKNLDEMFLEEKSYLAEILNKAYLPMRNAEKELDKVNKLLEIYSK